MVLIKIQLSREEILKETTPFTISKQLVMQAYKRVKANAGAAGIDQQSLECFGKGLKNNLYKLWNRMSSGSYFPPPRESCCHTEENRRGAHTGRADGGRPDCAKGGKAHAGT